MNWQRLAVGFGWGVVATVAMSILMILGMVSGVSPIPNPIPVALMANFMGADTAQPLLMLSGIVSHLVYGGIWAAILLALTSRVTLWKGLGLGVFLWILMQLIFLPILGWGMFGMAQDPRIAVATLILHLVYGAVLGWLADREGASYSQAEPQT